MKGFIDRIVNWMAIRKPLKQLESGSNLAPIRLYDALEDLGLGSRAIATQADPVAGQVDIVGIV